MKFKKVLLTVLCCTMAITAFAACGGEDDKKKPSGNSQSTQTPPAQTPSAPVVKEVTAEQWSQIISAMPLTNNVTLRFTQEHGQLDGEMARSTSVVYLAGTKSYETLENGSEEDSQYFTTIDGVDYRYEYENGEWVRYATTQNSYTLEGLTDLICWAEPMFAQFQYDTTSGTYYAQNFYVESIPVTLGTLTFANGQLTSISFTYTREEEDGTECTYKFSMQFSNYGTTKVTLPDEEEETPTPDKPEDGGEEETNNPYTRAEWYAIASDFLQCQDVGVWLDAWGYDEDGSQIARIDHYYQVDDGQQAWHAWDNELYEEKEYFTRYYVNAGNGLGAVYEYDYNAGGYVYKCVEENSFDCAVFEDDIDRFFQYYAYYEEVNEGVFEAYNVPSMGEDAVFDVLRIGLSEDRLGWLYSELVYPDGKRVVTDMFMSEYDNTTVELPEFVEDETPSNNPYTKAEWDALFLNFLNTTDVSVTLSISYYPEETSYVLDGMHNEWYRLDDGQRYEHIIQQSYPHEHESHELIFQYGKDNRVYSYDGWKWYWLAGHQEDVQYDCWKFLDCIEGIMESYEYFEGEIGHVKAGGVMIIPNQEAYAEVWCDENGRISRIESKGGDTSCIATMVLEVSDYGTTSIEIPDVDDETDIGGGGDVGGGDIGGEEKEIMYIFYVTDQWGNPVNGYVQLASEDFNFNPVMIDEDGYAYIYPYEYGLGAGEYTITLLDEDYDRIDFDGDWATNEWDTLYNLTIYVEDIPLPGPEDSEEPVPDVEIPYTYDEWMCIFESTIYNTDVTVNQYIDYYNHNGYLQSSYHESYAFDDGVRVEHYTCNDGLDYRIIYSCEFGYNIGYYIDSYTEQWQEYSVTGDVYYSAVKYADMLYAFANFYDSYSDYDGYRVWMYNTTYYNPSEGYTYEIESACVEIVDGVLTSVHVNAYCVEQDLLLEMHTTFEGYGSTYVEMPEMEEEVFGGCYEFYITNQYGDPLDGYSIELSTEYGTFEVYVKGGYAYFETMEYGFAAGEYYISVKNERGEYVSFDGPSYTSSDSCESIALTVTTYVTEYPDDGVDDPIDEQPVFGEDYFQVFG